MRRAGYMAVAMGLSATCKPSAPAPPAVPCDEPARVEIGTGVESFESVAELDDVDIVHGPQGGYHIVGALRLCAIPGPVKIRYQLREESSGVHVADVEYHRAIEPDETCCASIVDLYGYLFVEVDTGLPTNPSVFLDGRVVEVTMTVTDAEERTHEETARWRAVAP